MHNEFARSIRFRHTVGVLLGFGFVACLLEDDGVQYNVLLRMCVGLTPPQRGAFSVFMLIREKKKEKVPKERKKRRRTKRKGKKKMRVLEKKNEKEEEKGGGEEKKQGPRPIR